MSKIYIVQHCQSEHHINELTGGWTDTPLTPFGESQAVEVARELKKLGLGNDFELYSSDLKRASMTAEKIKLLFDQDVRLEPILREYNNGVAANKTKVWAKENRLWTSPTLELDTPLWENAETFRELFNRVKYFSDSVLKKREKDIVIVSHGVAIGHLIMSYLNLESDSLKHSLIAGNPGGISILNKSPMSQDTLKMFNSLAHLAHL